MVFLRNVKCAFPDPINTLLAICIIEIPTQVTKYMYKMLTIPVIYKKPNNLSMWGWLNKSIFMQWNSMQL